MVSISTVETEFGPLLLAATERGLCRIALPPEKEHVRFRQWLEQQGPVGPQGEKMLAQSTQELREYLAGQRKSFSVPLDVQGTEFFQKVWEVLQRIPYGRTLTYTAIATKAHRPRAFRAAGAACALNPMPIFIPCHRAVGSNGLLRGFAGGLAMKEALIKLEAAYR